MIYPFPPAFLFNEWLIEEPPLVATILNAAAATAAALFPPFNIKRVISAVCCWLKLEVPKTLWDVVWWGCKWWCWCCCVDNKFDEDKDVGKLTEDEGPFIAPLEIFKIKQSTF